MQVREVPVYRGEAAGGVLKVLRRALTRSGGFDKARAEVKLRLRLIAELGPRGTASLGLEIIARQPLVRLIPIVSQLAGKDLIEIGGPSPVFVRLIPIYDNARSLVNVDWTSSPEWRGARGAALKSGPRDHRSQSPLNIVSEGTDIESVPSASKDGLLASHVLEHVANPVKALCEWRRVLRSGGLAIIIVPKREFGFDHLRATTPVGHLVSDYTSGVGENDATHFNEVLAMHDISIDAAALPRAAFEERVRDNWHYRVVHHHVFEPGSLSEVAALAGFRTTLIDVYPVVGIVAVFTAGPA